MSHQAHDPGGKVRLSLKPGISGDATFSECGKYRTMLTRRWEGAARPGFVLWIGMNPSTAEGDVDDPTVAKECKFTRRWGYGEYRKRNVMDYRATHPKTLLNPAVEACSPANLPRIIAAAKEAALVVLAYGALHRKLARHGEAVLEALAREGIEGVCLGTTKAGHPRHPLYVLDSATPTYYRAPRVIN